LRTCEKLVAAPLYCVLAVTETTVEVPLSGTSTKLRFA
jgi:hypothetical protein